MNKFINVIPLVVLGVLACFSFTKTQPGALLPENKKSNPDIPENLAEYEVVDNSDGNRLRVLSLKGEVLKVRSDYQI